MKLGKRVIVIANLGVLVVMKLSLAHCLLGLHVYLLNMNAKDIVCSIDSRMEIWIYCSRFILLARFGVSLYLARCAVPA